MTLLNMSELARETIAIYNTARENEENALVGSANSSAVVRDVSRHVDPSHLQNLFSRSIIYPDPSTNHRARESVIFNETWRTQFSNLSLPMQGVSATIQSNVGVMKYMAISFELPANTRANVTLPTGWGIYLLDHVDLLIGGKSLQVFGQQIAQWYQHAARSQAELDALLSMAGALRTGTWSAGDARAVVLLPLPWCMPGGFCLDTSLLQASSLQVTLYMREITSVAGGSDAATYALSDAVNALANGQFIALTGQFTNPGRDSVLGELALHTDIDGANLVQSNLFQQMLFFPVLGEGVTAGTDKRINLTGFDQSRRLKGVVASFMLESNRAPTGGNPVNPGVYEDVTDIQILFQGRQLYATQHNEEQFYEILRNGDAAQTLSTSLITGATAPYTITNVSSRVYRMMFTLLDSEFIQEAGIPAVRDLTLVFRAPTGTYDIFISYVYDAALTFSGTSVEIN